MLRCTTVRPRGIVSDSVSRPGRVRDTLVAHHLHVCSVRCCGARGVRLRCIVCADACMLNVFALEASVRQCEPPLGQRHTRGPTFSFVAQNVVCTKCPPQRLRVRHCCPPAWEYGTRVVRRLSFATQEVEVREVGFMDPLVAVVRLMPARSPSDT